MKNNPQTSTKFKPVTPLSDNKREGTASTPSSISKPTTLPPFSNHNFSPDTLYPFESSPEYLLQQQKLRYEQQQKQEKIIFDRKQQELAKKIQEIRKELLNLAKKIGQEAKHIEKTLLQNVPEPTEYELSFLEKLRRFLSFLAQKISHANTWLEAWEQRAKKRRYYWYHFKKSGTKFWLSSERAVATQTG